VTTVPSLSLPGSIHEPSTTSVPGTDGGTDIHVPDQSSSRNPRPSPDDEGDLYAVPKSDTEDFVGIGSLGHIIRKCFKEIYYPEQPGSSDSVASVGGGESSVLSAAGSAAGTVEGSTFVEVSEEEIEKMDEEGRRTYEEEKAQHEALKVAAAAAAEKKGDGEGEDGEPLEDPETTRTEGDDLIASEEKDASVVVPGAEEGEGGDGDGDGEGENGVVAAPFEIVVPPEPPILPLPIAFEAKEAGAVEKERIDQGLRERVQQAKALLSHLERARESAMEEDERDRVELLEEHGLLLKVELPRGPSHLDLDPSELSSQW